MISNMRTKKYDEVSRDYDKAYKTGVPFLNPAWFIKKIKKVVDENSSGKRVLDIGCGDGHFLSNFHGYERYGIDISRQAIVNAKKNVPDGVFRVSKAEKLPFRSGFFGSIICMGSMEHFVDLGRALGEMKRVAGKNSVIIIHVPNSEYLVHKILRIKTHHQINERFATEKEWKEIISPYFSVDRVIKYNTRWFLKAIPKKYSCHFTFVCRNNQ